MLDNDFSMALVAPAPPPSGGMANQAQLLFDYLIKDGKTVYFIRTNAPYQPAWIEKVKIVRSLFRLTFYLFAVWKVAGKVKLFHVLSNSGWSWFLFSMPVLLIAKIRNVPVLINYRGGEADTFFEKSWRWVYPSLKTSKNITVPTRFLQSVFNKWHVKTNIVPNLIDLSLFKPTEHNHLNSPLHLIVTRNLETIYGNDIAIRAFKLLLQKYPESKLTIAGSGPEKDNLLQLVQDEQLEHNVVFAGKLARQEMADLYQSADIMLNASKVDNTPNSIIEALASGVLVVSSSVGGIPWLVKHKQTALLIEKNTPEDMASMVEILLNDKALLLHLKKNGYILADQFTWVNVKEKLYNNYEIALS